MVIEVKFASNADQGHMFTHTLGYASHLFGLSADTSE
ncbi:hypothetical protein amrb99_12800 [Actinomadura sp. RB99]|nr:hypothetical protein [Actinomadura sp. RB99]